MMEVGDEQDTLFLEDLENGGEEGDFIESDDEILDEQEISVMESGVQKLNLLPKVWGVQLPIGKW